MPRGVLVQVQSRAPIKLFTEKAAAMAVFSASALMFNSLYGP